MLRFFLLLVLHDMVSVNVFLQMYPKSTAFSDSGDPGQPLHLTPYLEDGKIEEARNLARVDFPGFPKIKSYAGFFTVDKKYNSNQFFWYFPAENEQTEVLKSAVYIWLQGGPGVTSLFGLLKENGAFHVKNNTFQLRDIRWSKTDHVIYIDNPVGAGFSFTNDSRGYSTNQTQIGEQLYIAVLQFFQLFPELQKYNFIISGESYAGKYIPALGYTIHKKNPTANIKINLKGLMIGDGWSDPVNHFLYASYLYQIGLIDLSMKRTIEVSQNKIIELIKKEAWADAQKASISFYDYINDSIGHISIYNCMKIDNIKEHDVCDYCQTIQTSSIRKIIHVGNVTFDNMSEDVMNNLLKDMMQSVAPWIEELLEHYHMLFYNGQADIIVAYPLTLNFLRKLKFSGSEDYLNAKRKPLTYTLHNKTILAGYRQAASQGKLMDVVIRNAGHMVPSDQPESMQYVMNQWRRWANI